jgi:hypothetical protein
MWGKFYINSTIILSQELESRYFETTFTSWTAKYRVTNEALT